ncbi:Phr family secreted Rap phosphatase inhibitor [Bacillus pseudomycoides]|uniref:Phr family secreted Rap phosphatase inhibitor n=1 Tax=Bacillus pseudomycoides TaxID=64104 RepID=A0AAJ2DML6_9BACI|nr:Phr family secreted Rap phosphatase inhibitor [Bacillus pseudomycoides]MDR4329260.1 Phr family secreted Rap phosphatase inhibitor [Bacillus pseudomycoides]
MKKIALSLMGAITVLTMIMMFGPHTKPTTDSKPISIAVQDAHGDTG